MTLDRVNTGPLLGRVERISREVVRADYVASKRRAELIQAMREARSTYTLEEIGRAAGLSRQRVSQLLS